VTYTAIQLKWPSWLATPKATQVVQVVEPGSPPPDERIVFAEQIAQLRNDHDFLRAELSAARQDLTRAQSYVEMLQNVTKNQDSLLLELSTQQSSTQTQLNQALADKQFQSKQIHELQIQNVELRAQVSLMADQLAINNGMRQGLQLAVDELKRENDTLRRQLLQLDRRTESERGE
jgi:chromosome segregation ATPase